MSNDPEPTAFPAEDQPGTCQRSGDQVWHLGLLLILFGLLALAGSLLP